MFFAYMDETGNSGAAVDPAQPIHMIACLMIADRNVAALERDLRAIAKKRLPTICDTPTFEFHASDMYSGRGPYKGLAVADRLAATRDVVLAVRKHADAYGYAGVDKVKFVGEDHPHRIAFALLLERIETWLQNHNDIGLIISDETNEIQRKLSEDYSSYKSARVEASAGPGTPFIDSVHFVRSHDSLALQAADVVAYHRLKSMSLSDNLHSTYFDLPSPRPPWPVWLEANIDDSKKATLALGEELNKMFCLSNKIFP